MFEGVVTYAKQPEMNLVDFIAKYGAENKCIKRRSHTPLSKWFVAIYLVSRDKRGFSALTLQKNIGVSYPTAWLMIHKIREAMFQSDDGYLLADIVEVDEAFFGASGVKQGRGTQKAKVIVQVSLTEESKNFGLINLFFFR